MRPISEAGAFRVVARLLAAALLSIAGVWGLAAPAHACSCAADQTDAQVFQRADVIFTGTVTLDETAGATRTLTLAVDRVYKGQATATQKIVTNGEPASCGLELKGRGPFLIMATSTGDAPGTLTTSLCDGSRAAPAPASLGDGYPPQPDPAPAPLTWTPTSATATLLIGITFLALALVIVRRRSGPNT